MKRVVKGSRELKSFVSDVDVSSYYDTNFSKEFDTKVHKAVKDFDDKISAVVDEFVRQFGKTPEVSELSVYDVDTYRVDWDMRCGYTFSDMADIAARYFDKLMSGTGKYADDTIVDSHPNSGTSTGTFINKKPY